VYIILKIACLAIYAVAAASIAVELPYPLAIAFRSITGIFLVVHVAEVFFCQRQWRLYQGASACSIALTLLFGFLHWKPLADSAARNSAR